MWVIMYGGNMRFIHRDLKLKGEITKIKMIVILNVWGLKMSGMCFVFLFYYFDCFIHVYVHVYS